MTVQELQAEIARVGHAWEEQHGVSIDTDFAMMKIAEEAGELTQAWLLATKRCRPDKQRPEPMAQAALAHELADLVGMAFFTADLLGIDVEAALRTKWIRKDAL